MSTSYTVRCTAAAVLLTAGASALSAATLSAVPMQGGMAMPMVSYDAMMGRVMVMMPPEIPQLTPLLVSHPADRFNEADPWYDRLDPSRQGLSFSRRYGFVMNTESAPLPDGTAIWIRKTAGSEGLGIYRYSGSAPKAFEPIFGTAGSTNAMAWNGMMFHPCVTAPPGTNALTATFELYLADLETGAEVKGSGSGSLTFNWANVADGRPVLELARTVTIAWPAGTEGYVLEASDDVTGTNWTPVTQTPVVVDGRPAVVLPVGETSRWFRLRKSP